MSVIVEVRDKETGAVLFCGAPVYEDPQQYVQISRDTGKPAVLRCRVEDFAASLSAVPAVGGEDNGEDRQL
jgi:hypothetical protein